MVKLIGLYASRPQCGKSTMATALSSRGFVIIPFAGTLKRMLRLMLLDLGLSELEVEHAMAGGKELPCPMLTSRTPRQLLQSLGTDWGRQMVDTNIWLRCWQQRVSVYLEQGIGVVVDDVRFPEEARLIEALGGAMVEVTRPGGGSWTFAAHASEGALDQWDFRARVVNDGGLERFERLADWLLEQLLKD
jgi:hypothetical protein